MAGDNSIIGRSNADINEQLMTAQQRLAYAQALRGESLKPIAAPGGQNGRISPLSALAQALNAYNAKGMVDSASHDIAQATAAQARYQMQDEADWRNHAGRYADQPPTAATQPPSQAPLGDQSQAASPGVTPANQALGRLLAPTAAGDAQADQQQGPAPDGQQSQAAGATQPSFPAMRNAALAALLQGGGQGAPQDGAGGAGSGAGGGAPAAQTGGDGSAATGQIGSGPSAAGTVTKPAISPSVYARALSQNTGGVGNMPDPMSDPSVRNLMIGARYGYAPNEVAGKAVDNFYKLNDNRTDLEKQLLSNGVMPGTPAWDKAHQDKLAHDNYLAPVQVEQGKVVLDPRTNKPFMQTPKMGDGMTANYTDPLNPTAAAVPGYAQGRAGIVGAETRAKADNEIRDVQGAGGVTLPLRAGKAADVAESQAGLGPAIYTGGPLDQATLDKYRRAADAGNADARQFITAYTASKQPLGQSQSDKLMTEQGKDVYSRVMSENTNNAQYRSTLNEIYTLAQHGQFGPGAAGMARVKALAQNIGVDMSGAQTDQDVMKKLSYFLAMSQLGQGGTGTNQQLDGILNQVPNGAMTNDAIKKVIPQLVSQIDAREARGRVVDHFVSNGGQLSQLQSHLAKYNAIADPGTVSLGKQMHDASQNGTAGQLFKQIQAKYPKTWQGVLGRVQQLEQMGAF